MASIATSTKSSQHTRCNSLPTETHPIVSQFEEHLQRLKGSDEATPSLSSSSVSRKLDGLQDLHDCTDKLLQLPIEQQALAQECNDKRVDELLEDSLKLLDICITAKDCIMQSKERMQEFLSVIRRRRSDETEFTAACAKYLSSRKMTKKGIQKSLENLKAMKNELIASSSSKENNTFSMLRFLQESEDVTVSSLEHFLLFISGTKAQSKWSKWSKISKMVQTKRVTCNSQESETNEFEKVDADLQCLTNHKHSSMENFRSSMENLEMCIQDLEIGVEKLSRKLIRNRVSLLNIFNH